MARRNDDTPPGNPPRTNISRGALRYVRSQQHLTGSNRTGARGGRDDVSAFEQDTWRGRDQRMREMHSGSATPSGTAVEQPATRSSGDVRIREAVSEVLTVHELVDASEIEVDVKDGVVTLTGTVSSRGERREAEEALFRVSGVVDVINQLRVLPREVTAPFER